MIQISFRSEPLLLKRMISKILWISRLGFPCSYHSISKDLIRGMRSLRPGRYDFYFHTLTITPTSEQVSRFLEEFETTPDHFYFPRVDYDMSTPEDQRFESLVLSGYLSVVSVINWIKPELVLVLEDTEPINIISDSIRTALAQKKLVKNFKLAAYVPIDCDGYGHTLKDTIYDYYITPTRHGRREIEPFVRGPIFVLPHQINMPETIVIAESGLASSSSAVEERKELVILSVNGNHVRKRWDLVFRSFLGFAQIYPHPVRLIIKIDKLEGTEMKATVVPFQRFDLPQLYTDLANEIPSLNTEIEFIDRHLTQEEMAKLYRRSDIGLYMTSGEGFGLTPMEGSRLGIPQVVPDNTSFRELFPYYPYRVQTQRIPLYEGRVAMKDQSDSFVCIFRNHASRKGGIEVKEVGLPISNIPTILLGPTMTTILVKGCTIKPIRRISTFLELVSGDFPPRYQILLSLKRSFLGGLDWDHYPGIFQMGSLLAKGCCAYVKKEEIFCRYGMKEGTVELPIVDDAVNKLVLLADQKNRKRAGKMCQAYASKFTADNVSRHFANILDEMIPYLPPVVIFSYERSGTHFLINSLIQNFGYSSSIDMDDLSLFDQRIQSYPGFLPGKIYKCHHVYDHIRHYPFTGCILLKLERERCANLESYRRFLWLLPSSWKEGPQVGDSGDSGGSGYFPDTLTEGKQERYQITSGITQIERYDGFHRSYSERDDLINIEYQDLITNFGGSMDLIASRIGKSRGSSQGMWMSPTKLDLGIL